MLMHMAGLLHTICNDAELQHLFPPFLPYGSGSFGQQSWMVLPWEHGGGLVLFLQGP